MPPIRPLASRLSGSLLLAALLFLAAAPPCSAGAVCGNGILEAGEECDDGGLQNLDGCDQSCRYEQVQRFTSLALEGLTAPAFCDPTTNQLGGAFTAIGLPVLNSTLQGAVDSGDLTVLFDFLGLDDATGQNDPSLNLGLLGGAPDPQDPSPGGLDSWYLVRGGELDGSGLPSQRLAPGSITAGALAAGPSDVSVPFLGGALQALGTRVHAQVGATTSLPDPPPSPLVPGFLAFETLDATGAGAGLCGNVTVGTLAAIPVPDAVTVGGQPCLDCAGSMAYVPCPGGIVTDSCHSLLDVLVGGCKVTTGCLITVSVSTQPDVGAGGNPPHALTFAPTGGGIEKVTVVEPDDAYSSWFQFASQRVHALLDVVFGDGFESGDTSAWSAAIP